MLPAALDRKIHDAWTSIRNTIGLRFKENDGESLSFKTLIDGKTSHINNQWEHNFNPKCDAVETASNPPCRLYTLDNVMLSGDRAHVFLDSNTLLTADAELAFENKSKIRHPIRSLARKIDQPLFHLGGANHENHGHFITQFLPRILACLSLLHDNPDILILVPPTHKRWQARYLAYFDIAPERIIEGTAGTLLCKRLYYCPLFHGSNDLVQAELYTQLQARFLKGLPDEINSNKNRVIFLSRSDAPDRKLANESALTDIIKNLLGSVEVIHLAQLSLDDQIKLLNEAKWVIAPQGQGLTTTLFSRHANVLILESQQPAAGQRDWASSFRDLAIYAGNNAVRLYVDTKNANKGDWVYPQDKFQEELKQLIGCIPKDNSKTENDQGNKYSRNVTIDLPFSF